MEHPNYARPYDPPPAREGEVLRAWVILLAVVAVVGAIVWALA